MVEKEIVSGAYDADGNLVCELTKEDMEKGEVYNGSVFFDERGFRGRYQKNCNDSTSKRYLFYLIFARRPLPYLNMGGDELPF